MIKGSPGHWGYGLKQRSKTMNIKKFNRRFNTRRKSMERWHNLVIKLHEFEGIVNSYDGASPSEVKALKTIHRKLYECCTMAKEHLKEAENLEGFLR